MPSLDRVAISRLPEGAVSIESDGQHWKLRASRQVQSRFEELLDGLKGGQLSERESQEYRDLCELDALLSGFNRLARQV